MAARSYVAVNTDVNLLSYFPSTIDGIMLKDIKQRHSTKMISQPIPVCLAVDSMMVRTLICRLDYTQTTIWSDFPKGG